MRKLSVLVLLLAASLIPVNCKNPLSSNDDSSGKGYQISIQSNTYWEWGYSPTTHVTNSGEGNRVQDIHKEASPTCVVVTNTRSTGYITASILKGGKAIDSGTSSSPYGSVTVCTD